MALCRARLLCSPPTALCLERNGQPHNTGLDPRSYLGKDNQLVCFYLQQQNIPAKHTMTTHEEKPYCDLEDDLPLPELTYQPEKTPHENMYHPRTHTPQSKSRLGQLLRGKYQPWIITVSIVTLVAVAAAVVGMAFVHGRGTGAAVEKPASVGARSFDTETAQFNVPCTMVTTSTAASTATSDAQMSGHIELTGSSVIVANPQTSGSLQRYRKWWMHTGLVHGLRKIWRAR